jgi:hypothetical protein
LVTEQDVIHALPTEGFIRAYVIHAMKQTTSPLCYHLGIGMSILAATCPLNYGMWYAGALRANMFTLLVGRSGEDRKSSALGIGREILFASAAALIGDYPGSPEGLIDSLARAPSQIIPISEFGRFLSSAQRGYFEAIKTLLADLWDSQPLQRAKANGRTVRVQDPRLSIMAACSIPYLEKHTLAEDWSGGFMGRWAVMYGKQERVDPDPVGDRTYYQPLVDFLSGRASTPTAGWCEGLDKEASSMWNDWYHDLYKRKLPNQICGVKARAPTIARKVALIYGWDFGGGSQGVPWRLSIKELEPALKFAELHIKSLVGLSGKIADHPDARLRRSVLECLDHHKGTATLGQILSILKMRKRPVVETLDSLLEEGKIAKASTAHGYAYVLR